MDKFLSTHVTDKKSGKITTFTGMGAQKGSWCVSDSEYDTFLDSLHDHIFIKRKQPYGFVERPRGDGVIPSLIDLDFHFDSDSTLGHTFSMDMIRRFLESYMKVLSTHFEIGEKKSMRFFITLRPQAYKDSKKDIIKDGVHIECPDITLLDKHQQFIRSKLLEEDIIDNVFGSIGFNNSVDEVYDNNIYKSVGWFFYGETKSNIGAYKLELIYKYDVKKEKWTEEACDKYTERTLMEILSIRYKLSDTLKIRPESTNTIEEWCSKQSGVRPQNSTIFDHDKELIMNEVVEKVKEITREATYLFDNYISKDQMEFIKSLVLDCLSVERANDFMSWMRVGWCLRNIEASEQMFDLWVEFSHKSDKFKESEVGNMQRQWLKGSMQRIDGVPILRLGSLHKWAREDNPTHYKEIIEEDIHVKIQQIARVAKGGTHYHVAQIVHMMYSDRYKCHVEARGTEWYEFTNNTWKHVPQAISIKQKLSTEVASQVSKARQKVSHPGDEEREMKDKNLLLDLERNLYSNNFKNSIIKECEQLFVDEDFHKKMNADAYKIGCANGILHLRAEEVKDANGKIVGYKSELRPGTPEDYVSFQVGVCNINNVSLEAFDYVPYNPNEPYIKDILDFFAQIFPNPELREYVLTLAAGSLEGSNMEQSFYIMTGSGSNGKSKFVNFMKYCLGDYASSLSTTTITRKRPDAGAANPDLITIKNRRFIDMAEPDEREQLNTAIIKQLSGGDTLMARGLFKDQEQIKVSGKMFLATNRMPKVESMDGGTWRRIKVIAFLAKFLDPGHPQIDPANNYYEKDYGLEEKLQEWRQAFLSLLVHYYETRYAPAGIRRIPDMVNQYTNEYKSSHDSFEKFLHDRIRVATTKDPRPTGSTASMKVIYSVFKSWADENSAKKLSENELKIRLEELFNKPADGKTFMHMRLFRNDIEMEEYNNEADE